jgi:hypothetical protein
MSGRRSGRKPDYFGAAEEAAIALEDAAPASDAAAAASEAALEAEAAASEAAAAEDSAAAASEAAGVSAFLQAARPNAATALSARTKVRDFFMESFSSEGIFASRNLPDSRKREQREGSMSHDAIKFSGG